MQYDYVEPFGKMRENERKPVCPGQGILPKMIPDSWLKRENNLLIRSVLTILGNNRSREEIMHKKSDDYYIFEFCKGQCGYAPFCTDCQQEKEKKRRAKFREKGGEDLSAECVPDEGINAG